MLDISLLSIVSGRKPQLENLLLGVSRQTTKPREVVIVFMNEPVADDLPDPGCRLRLETITDTKNRLPLAKARNRAARLAKADTLAFLDVDCIPGRDYAKLLRASVEKTRGLVMGDIRYLPEGAADGEWTFDDLESRGVAHPKRPLVENKEGLIPLAYHLFWSLAFGLPRQEFERLGGFDEDYPGYGGEDTDFAFTARQIRLPLFACNARAYHQYHPTYSPPYNYLSQIVENARRFHEKWQVWPMEGWLRKFQDEGYIEWTSTSIRVLAEADARKLEEARSTEPYG